MNVNYRAVAVDAALLLEDKLFEVKYDTSMSNLAWYMGQQALRDAIDYVWAEALDED